MRKLLQLLGFIFFIQLSQHSWAIADYVKAQNAYSITFTRNSVPIQFSAILSSTNCYSDPIDPSKYYYIETWNQNFTGAQFSLPVALNTLISSSTNCSYNTFAYLDARINPNLPTSCPLQSPWNGGTGAANVLYCSFTYPGACNNSIYYVGFKKMVASNYHYGWLKMRGLEILEGAYETIPGFPLMAGDTKGFGGTSYSNYNVIQGSVYFDANNNCIKDVSEIGLANIPVFSSAGDRTMTDASGTYYLVVPATPLSTQVDVDTSLFLGRSFTKLCPAVGVTQAVTFTSGGNQLQQNKNFGVRIRTCHELEVNVSFNRRRRCFRSFSLVNYRNTGSLATAAEVKVVMPQFVVPISSTPAWTSKSGDTLTYSIANIAGLSAGTIRITDSVACEPNLMGLNQCTEAFITPANYCVSYVNWDFSDVQVSGYCLGSSMTINIHNNGIGAMSDSAEYRIFLNNALAKVAKYKLVANQVISYTAAVDGSSIRVEADQLPNHPEVRYRSFSMEGCGNFTTQTIARDSINTFPLDVNGSKHSVSCGPIRDSYDPNDKQASPAGVGPEHEIQPNGDIVYTIRFQNMGNDDAYTVVVVDTLSANLDLGSLRIQGTSHAYRLEVSGSTNPQLMWIFPNINLKAASVNEPLSHGFITYKISQKENLSPGTLIHNKADIFFDYNESVITNRVTHTISNDPVTTNFLRVSTQPQAQAVCTGAGSQFSLQANGPAAISYQWYKDNQLLVDSTNAGISIANSNAANTGMYRCRMVSFLDTLYSNAVALSLNPNPEIQTTNISTCNSTADLTDAFDDLNSTSGSVSYWSDLAMQQAVPNAAAVAQSGTYYIHKETTEGCSDLESIAVIVNGCNSIDEALSSTSVSVYPNPASDYLIVKSSQKVQAVVLNAVGKTVIPGLEIASEEATTIPISELASGLYILRMTQGQHSSSVEFVKK